MLLPLWIFRVFIVSGTKVGTDNVVYSAAERLNQF